MAEPSRDAFALQRSGLGPFLYAHVGIDLNGAPLTTLTMLARLRGDPWAEAALWTTLPKATVIDNLVQAMSAMPLAAASMAAARATSERLVLLLPTSQAVLPSADVATGPTAPANWVRLLLLALAFALALAFSNGQFHRAPPVYAPPAEQPAQGSPAASDMVPPSD